ncbi:MAG: hypothetical protein MJZ04_01895 [Bacteroidales bacterium]|nr:hypothetical protein [Bacteroidales bacterium]
MLSLIATMILHVATANAQSLEPFNPYGLSTPGVEAWSMTRFGGVSPSLYNGAMTYSYPVFTYEDHDFTIPISLEYIFEGYRPSQHSGSVGYGWHLNCGGVITREVRGLPDEGPWDNADIHGYLEMSNIGYTPSAYGVSSVAMILFGDIGWSYDEQPSTSWFASSLANFDFFSDVPVYHDVYWNSMEMYDTASDLYHFSFLGHHGDFILNPDGSTTVFNSDLPEGEITVAIQGYASYQTVLTFTITLGDGKVYHFGGDTDYIEYSYSLYCSGHPSTSVTPVSFHLHRIDAPNGRHVDFTFADGKALSVNSHASYTPDTPVYGAASAVVSSDIKHIASCTCTPVITGFTVDGSSVVSLDYAQPSYDENAVRCFGNLGRSAITYRDVSDPLSSSTRLSSITVKNVSGNIVDRFTLAHSYVRGSAPRMFLTSVSSIRTGNHSFSYNTPSNLSIPLNDTQAFDHWGFWNGYEISDLRSHLASGNPSDLYTQMRTTAKAPSFTHSSYGALTSITYPTGGTTDITYETHRVSKRINKQFSGGTASIDACSTPYEVGGVRVHSITDNSGSSSDTRTFSYVDMNGECSGVLSRMPLYRCNLYCTYTYGTSGPHFYINSKGYSNECSLLRSRDGHVGYSYVRTTYPDGSYDVMSFSTYDDPYMDDYEYGSSLVIDKMIYSVHDAVNDPGTYDYDVVRIPSKDMSNMRGLLLSTDMYDADGRFKGVETNYYTEILRGQEHFYTNGVASFIYQSSMFASPRLERKTKTLSLDGGSVTETVSLSYNTLGQVYCTTTSNSSGETVKGYLKYLHQSNSSALKSIISDAVKTKVVNGQERVVAVEKYSYSNPTRNTRPSSITEYGVSGSVLSASNVFAVPSGAQSRTISISYDSQYRPTNISRPGGSYTSYTWSGRNPVSRTDNASANTTEYSWKDLVGLTAVNRPDGTSETYQYNSRNRLWKTFNSSGNLIQRNDVHLENEM